MVIRLKINLFEDYELTDEFFDSYSLDDIIFFTYAEPGAMGKPGNIEVVVKLNENEIAVFSGSYLWGNPKLSEKKVMSCFDILNNFNNYPEWIALNMGVGNTLFIKDSYSKEFIKKYTSLVNSFPFILYDTWREYADYILNIYFNNIDDKKKLSDIDEHIAEICE